MSLRPLYELKHCLLSDWFDRLPDHNQSRAIKK